jgi:hypothetical protein
VVETGCCFVGYKQATLPECFYQEQKKNNGKSATPAVDYTTSSRLKKHCEKKKTVRDFIIRQFFFIIMK